MIRLHNLGKSYATRQGMIPVLSDINMTIARGEKVGILGRNGAGKSTLIRLIGGGEQPSRGYVERGMTVSWPLAFAGGFQGSLTGLDNVRFICRVYGVDAEAAAPFVDEFAELGRWLREPVKSYSSGMRARLAFALSMAIEFDCYLIDEVLAVGDRRFHEKSRAELFEKRAERALLIVSHLPDQIRQHCSAFYVLSSGKIRRFDDADEAYGYYEREG